MPKNPDAVRLGRKGGKSTSPAKQAAVRANVQKAREALANRTWCASPGCENKKITGSHFCANHQG